VNTTGSVRERRPVLSAAEMVGLFGCTGGNRPLRDGELEEIASRAAAVFDPLDAAELVGLWADCSAIAADLDQALGVRRLAATVALAAESAHDDGQVSWDRALDYIAAGEYLNYEQREARNEGR
jgi:hypothetical protein